MSIFGNLPFSIQDALNRLPQFEYQINKLGVEEKNSRRRPSLRNHFIRQCQELHKQIDDYQKRTEKIKSEESYKKETILEQIDRLKRQLSILCPEKEPQSSFSTSSEQEMASQSRRKSVMYDGDDSDSDDTEIIETDVNLGEPTSVGSTNPPAPQPAPRKPIKITDKPDDRTEDVRRLQNPTEELEPTQIMEPIVVKGNIFVAIADLAPETDGDLALVKGKKYRITQTRDDGWWTGLDEDGKRGMVPKTYLRHVKEKPKVLQSKVSSRLGVRDSVIGISTTTDPISNREESKTRKCLGLEFDEDPHLSLICHLTPRLSTSNIGFHDLFWTHQKDHVFRRTVHVSKIIRLVRFEKMPLIQHKALVRLALVDVTNPKCTQVVSNVHTIVPRVKNGTWHFEKKESGGSCVEHADFVLRSNYSSPTVVLVVEASHIVRTSIGFEEKSLGHTWMRLMVDEKAVTSRTHVLYLDDEIMNRMKLPETSKKRVLMQVMDVGKDRVHMVDSLPDVIVFNALHLPFFHFYRRRAGTILIRDNRNPLSAEFVSDPLLSVFPYICDQHDIMDALLDLWRAKKKILAKKNEAEQTAEFFQTFIHTAFFIHGAEIVPYDVKDDSCLSIRLKTIQPIVETLKRGMLKEYISNQKWKPINILDYSLDLLGPHSMD